MRFIMAYSGGKDCTLAMDRLIREGHECVAMVILTNLKGTSFNHALPIDIIKQYEACFGIPVEVVRSPELYDFAPLLASAGELKQRYQPDAVCFGDIFLEGSRRTNEKFAEAVGAEALFPLWKNDSALMFEELFERGYTIIVKSVDTKKLPESLLGRVLDEQCIQAFRDANIDISGENGEYHTLAIDGPLFAKPLKITPKYVYRSGSFATLVV